MEYLCEIVGCEYCMEDPYYNVEKAVFSCKLMPGEDLSSGSNFLHTKWYERDLLKEYLNDPKKVKYRINKFFKAKCPYKNILIQILAVERL